MNFEDKEQCIGYFGFGSGHHLTGQAGAEGYCNKCPLNQKCWESHLLSTASPGDTATLDFRVPTALINCTEAQIRHSHPRL